MGEARNIHGIVDRRGNRVALSSDQRRGDRSIVSGHDGANALVDGLTHIIDNRGVL